MTIVEHQNQILVPVSTTDSKEPYNFREIIPEGIEEEGGMPEVEEKLSTSGDPRMAVVEWQGKEGEVEVYAPWVERTERWVMFIPRAQDDAKKFNKITFMRDIMQPDAPVILRRKIAVGKSSETSPLTRRELHNPEEELPQVIAACGGNPDQDYPVSPHSIRDRVERLVVDQQTGYVFSITGDFCYLVDDPGCQNHEPLYQSEIEFKGTVGGQDATVDQVISSMAHVNNIYSSYLEERDLNPQHTKISKSKWLERIARNEGMIT